MAGPRFRCHCGTEFELRPPYKDGEVVLVNCPGCERLLRLVINLTDPGAQAPPLAP